MVQLSATRCICIAILLVSLVSFATITFCTASQRVFIVVYLIVDSVRKRLDIPSYFTLLYFTLLYFTSLHFTSLHFTSLHQIVSQAELLIGFYLTKDFSSLYRVLAFYFGILYHGLRLS
jgi:hypothetical protein